LYKKKTERFFGPQKKLIRSITYTPDFVGEHNGVRFVVETKGNPNETFPLRWKLFKRYLFERQMENILYLPRNQKQVDETVELIKSIGKK